MLQLQHYIVVIARYMPKIFKFSLYVSHLSSCTKTSQSEMHVRVIFISTDTRTKFIGRSQRLILMFVKERK